MKATTTTKQQQQQQKESRKDHRDNNNNHHYTTSNNSNSNDNNNNNDHHHDHHSNQPNGIRTRKNKDFDNNNNNNNNNSKQNLKKVRRKHNDDENVDDDDDNDDDYDVDKQHKHKNNKNLFGVCWTAVFSGVAFIFFGAALMLPLVSQLDMTIHSCDIYSPSVVPAVTGATKAIGAFFLQEGFGMFLEVFWHLTRIEVFRRPPYYQGDDVRGKTLLVLGGSYIPEFFDTARRLGVNVVVVDDMSQEKWMRTQAAEFIGIKDFPRVSITNPETVIQLIRSSKYQNIKFDGVTTLVEDQGPLVARLAEALGLVGSPVHAADVARNKVMFRDEMLKAKLTSPRYYAIDSESDLEAAAKQVGLPAFLKPVFGVAATFASTVHTMEELRETYRKCQRGIDPVAHPIYHYGRQMMLEGIMKGSEIQLELMLYNGEIVFHCFSSQYSPSRDFVVFPSNLTAEQKSQMLEVASATVRVIGLTWGVVHLEMFLDNDSPPQVIEVNNRLSRGFLPQQYFHQLFFGEKVVDYFGSVIFLALGLKPPLHPRTTPVASVAVFPHGRSEVGWETKGPCAIFFAPSPREALNQGMNWKMHGQPADSMPVLVLQLVALGIAAYGLAHIGLVLRLFVSKQKQK